MVVAVVAVEVVAVLLCTFHARTYCSAVITLNRIYKLHWSC